MEPKPQFFCQPNMPSRGTCTIAALSSFVSSTTCAFGACAARRTYSIAANSAA
jgi:hypothetical protein